MPKSHVLLIILINIVWALNIVALKFNVLALPPLAAASLRYVLVLLFCLPFLRSMTGRLPLLAGTALVAGACYNGMNAIGFRVADNVASLALAGQMGIPFALLFGTVFLGERISARRMLGIALALAGVALITFDARLFDERLGLFLVMIACACWAAGGLLFRKLQQDSVLSIHAWLAIFALPWLVIFSLLLEPDGFATVPHLDGSAWGWFLFSALGSYILGHVGISWLLQRHPISTILPLTIPSPVLSVIFAAIAFDIPVTAELIGGSVLTLGGIAIITLDQSRSATAESS